MKMFNRILLFTICLTFFGEIVARPVSWSGGSTLMYKTNVMKSSYYYHYSPTYKYSIGAEYIDDKHFDDRYLSVRTTYLLNRKNTKTSQRNLYFTASLSTEDIEKFYYGLHGDWETRRIFTAFSYVNNHTNNKDYSEMELQAGIAPYLGEYNELHTWIMMKTKKETINNSWDTYPFIKIFKGDFLIEIGTKNSHWDIHYMLRF